MNLIQKPSPNFTSGRNWQRIKKVFIHWVAVGTAESAANYFQNPSSQVSAHYVVGNDTVYQCVAEKDTAWHAGVWEENLKSIGIEHEATPDKPATELTYKTSAALIADICKRHDIEINSENIVGHKSVKATQCPGTVDIDKLISLARGENMDDCEKKIEEMQEEIDGLRSSRNEWKEKYNDLSEKHALEIGEKNNTIEQLQKSAAELTSNLTGLRKDIDSLREDKLVLERNFKALEISSEASRVVLENEIKDLSEHLAFLIKKNEDLKNNLSKITFWEFIKIKFGR